MNGSMSGHVFREMALQEGNRCWETDTQLGGQRWQDWDWRQLDSKAGAGHHSLLSPYSTQGARILGRNA